MLYNFCFQLLGAYWLLTRLAASSFLKDSADHSKITYLSKYGLNQHKPLWLPPLICFLVIATINILASSVDYTKTSKILVPIIFLAEYVAMFLIYCVSYNRFLQKPVRKLFYWNIVINYTESVVALASLVLYLTGKCSLISCLWVSSKVKLLYLKENF